MSVNQEESGIIKLPTAEFSKVKKSIEEAITRDMEATFAMTQDMWSKMTPADKKNSNTIYAAVDRMYGRPYQFRTDADNDRVNKVMGMFSQAEWKNGNKPARPKRGDMDFPTNRTMEFNPTHEASIKFDRESSTVIWNVYENNHAVDDARASAGGKAFFNALSKVHWSRGTGGMISGDNENNETWEGHSNGAYDSDGFGPIGAATNPSVTEPYIDSTGKRVDPKTEFGRRFKESGTSRISSPGMRGGGVSDGNCQEFLPRAKRRCNRPIFHNGPHR